MQASQSEAQETAPVAVIPSRPQSEELLKLAQALPAEAATSSSQASTWGGGTARTEPGSLGDSWQGAPPSPQRHSAGSAVMPVAPVLSASSTRSAVHASGAADLAVHERRGPRGGQAALEATASPVQSFRSVGGSSLAAPVDLASNSGPATKSVSSDRSRSSHSRPPLSPVLASSVLAGASAAPAPVPPSPESQQNRPLSPSDDQAIAPNTSSHWHRPPSSPAVEHRAVPQATSSQQRRPPSPNGEGRAVAAAPNMGQSHAEERATAAAPVTVVSPATAAALQRVAACAEAITVAELRSLRALSRPHLALREVVEMALMLLGYRDAKWSAAQGLFGRPEDFLSKMRAFDPARNVSRLQYQKLCRTVSGPQGSLDEGHAESFSAACGGLVRWCRAVYEVLALQFGSHAPRLTSRGGNQQREGSATRTPPMGASATTSLGSSNGGLRSGGAPAPAPAVDLGKCDASSQPYRSDVPEPEPESINQPVRSRPDLGDMEIFPDIYAMSTADLRRVRNLTIRRADVGEVTFQCEIDLTRERAVLEDLPNIIRLDPGEVVLYPDPGTKPAEGEGLNRPAMITLFKCMPPNNGIFPDPESKARYRDRIARMTEQKGARFVDYDCDRGIWQFRVDHF